MTRDSNEKRRWMLNGLRGTDWIVNEEGLLGDDESVEVMPVSEHEAEIRRLYSAIWGYFQLAGRPAQAEGLLRSALPDGYAPVGDPKFADDGQQQRRIDDE